MAAPAAADPCAGLRVCPVNPCLRSALCAGFRTALTERAVTNRVMTLRGPDMMASERELLQ